VKKITLILFLLSLTLFANEKPSVTQLFSVQTVKVKEQTTSHSKKNYGYVTSDETKIYDVSPRFGGYVQKLYADKIYKFVKKGEPLALIYSPEVYKAKNDYLNSYRYTKFRNNKEMLHSVKLKLELLNISKREIKSILKNKKVSKYTTIYSPASGYIFIKNIVNGSAFNAKQKLFEIVNLDEVWVETKIFEDDVKWIKKANTFNIHFKTTNKVYTAHNKFLYPNLNPKEATLTMRIKLNNKDNTLFPGMYANVISKDITKTYLTLPQSAVIRKDDKYYVFTVGEYEGEYNPDG